MDIGSDQNIAVSIKCVAKAYQRGSQTVPVLEDEGMPLGVQMLAGIERDAALFSAAAWALGGTLDRPDPSRTSRRAARPSRARTG